MNKLQINPINKDLESLISETPIFDENEQQELMEAKSSMSHAFEYSQIFRTDTEARISVLNPKKHPTPSSKFFQALKELNVHQQELANLIFDYRDKQQDMKILEIEIEELEDYLHRTNYSKHEIEKTKCEIEKKRIKLQREQFSIRTIKRIADDRKREILMWHKIIEELKPEIVKENMSLTDPNDHQLISYSLKLYNMLKNQLTENERINITGQLEGCLELANSKDCQDKIYRLLEG